MFSFVAYLCVYQLIGVSEILVGLVEIQFSVTDKVDPGEPPAGVPVLTAQVP